MTYLLGFAILSLFTPFKIATGLVQIRPFDALTGLALAVAFMRGRIFPREGPPLGLLILLPYFAWHVLSALSVDLSNGAREGLQLVTVAAFAWALTLAIDEVDFNRIGRLLLVGMVVITAWSISWHIANGYWSGWKRLLDPKATFTFMPLLFGFMIVAREGVRRGFHWFGWCFLGSVILASGERKALIIYALLSAALIARGRLLSSLYVIGGAFAMLVVLSGIIEDPYLSRQIRSVVDPFDSGDFSSAIATGEARQGDTRSNAQRGFALALAGDLIAQHMLFGVGTNEYERIVQQRYAYLPEFLRAGIHGEFLRILTENGLIGLLSYLAVWLVAWYRTHAVLRAQADADVLTTAQAALLQIVAFVPCLLYVSFEASGTHSIVVLTFISLLPEGLTAWRERASEYEVSPAAQSVLRRPMVRQPVGAARQGFLGGSL
jgi:uncharacterized membrane protein